MYFPDKTVRKKCEFKVPSKSTNLNLLDFRVVFPGKCKGGFSGGSERKETLIVLVQGKCQVSVGNKKYILGCRKNVFDAPSHSLYLPAGNEYVVRSQKEDSLLCVISVPSLSSEKKIIQIRPENVKQKIVGKDVSRRTVHTIFSPADINGQGKLIVGETFNAPGKWSSWPPHKHSVDNLPHESRYEEVYFFRVRPANGYGLLKFYNNKLNEVYTIKDYDCAVVTDGFHPVCAAPGCEVYYLWALVGNHDKVINSYDSSFEGLQR